MNMKKELSIAEGSFFVGGYIKFGFIGLTEEAV